MSVFKINIAMIRDCPPLITLKAALETVGRPTDKDYGVLGVHEIVEKRLEFAIFRTKEVKVKQVEKSDGSVSHGIIRRDELFEAAIVKASDSTTGVLEVYTGSVKSIEVVGEFLKTLELADQNPSIEFLVMDLLGNLGKLDNDIETKTSRVVAAKVKGYEDANDDQLKGVYNVKFPKELPPANARAFLNDHADRVETVKVAYQRKDMKKPMNIVLRPSAFFSISAADADETKSKNVGRRLTGVL